MPKKSEHRNKLKQWVHDWGNLGTFILALATVLLAIGTLVAGCHYRYERIIGSLSDEYTWDKTIFMVYGTSANITSDERTVLQKDLEAIHQSLWTAENALLHRLYLPSANSDNVILNLNRFNSDWTKFTEKSSQNENIK